MLARCFLISVLLHFAFALIVMALQSSRAQGIPGASNMIEVEMITHPILLSHLQKQRKNSVSQAHSTKQKAEEATDSQESQEIAPPISGGVATISWPIYRPAPEYPHEARRLGFTGIVIIELHTDSTGRVVQAKLESSSGHQILDEVALDSIKSWRLPPNIVARTPIEFRLRN